MEEEMVEEVEEEQKDKEEVEEEEECNAAYSLLVYLMIFSTFLSGNLHIHSRSIIIVINATVY